MTQSTSPIDVMRRLRQRWLATSRADLELAPKADFPHCHGVLVEFHVGKVLCTIAAFADRGAHLITSTHFGVIGGPPKPEAQAAALRLLAAVQPLASAAERADEFPYPNPGRIRLYLLLDSEVRYLDAPQLPADPGSDRLAPVYAQANELLEQLRQRVADR